LQSKFKEEIQRNCKLHAIVIEIRIYLGLTGTFARSKMIKTGLNIAAGEPELNSKRLLTDPFGRIHDYLRISITDKCNLRCSYCMPDEKVSSTPSAKLMTPDEIFEIASVFSSLGVKKIRITGGEPLVRIDATDIIRKLAKLPVQLNMTTNATRVHLFIEDLIFAGVKSINVSLDTFSEEKFLKLTRRNNLHQILSNIHLLLQYPFEVKINAVVMRGVNDDEICDFIEFTRENRIDVRFIEFMPFPGNHWHKEQVFGYDRIITTISEKYNISKLNDAIHSTSRNYQVPGYKGSFGIISTVTKPFCGDCNRLRLTADGKIKNCLFSKGEIDLLTPFRKGASIEELIFASVDDKKKELGGQKMAEAVKTRSMISIGG
jgi:GTP 3',8-cyclase